MTNTNDMPDLLPCPFCGASPEAMDWHGGPKAQIFIECPNGNYADEDGGCSVGPDVVGSDMEDAAARWNRRAINPDASGLAQTLVKIEAGKTKLVEALEKIDAILQTANSALAAHRSQGGEA